MYMSPARCTVLGHPCDQPHPPQTVCRLVALGLISVKTHSVGSTWSSSMACALAVHKSPFSLLFCLLVNLEQRPPEVSFFAIVRYKAAYTSIARRPFRHCHRRLPTASIDRPLQGHHRQLLFTYIPTKTPQLAIVQFQQTRQLPPTKPRPQPDDGH